ncbi:MAG: ferritin-like domain-containing protein [Actinomycetia bacterium]|nr:ferritin-like domain-containing protein [Actinomycetes bacterium]
MADFLTTYSIQRWLELCPQGYLDETVHGHGESETEPEGLIEDDDLRTEAIRTTVQLVVGERAALAASSGLINIAPDYPSKQFLATQTLDEARHVEIFTERLYDLNVKPAELETTIEHFANPHLIKFAEVLLEKVGNGDFVAGVVGQNIVLEGMAFSVFEMMEALSRQTNPKFANTLTGTIADERRHVGFGENRIGSLLQEHPEKKPEIERMQQEMTGHMLATFASAFDEGRALDEKGRQAAANEAAAHGEELEEVEWHGTDLTSASVDERQGVLENTVLGEFKTRLARIGLEYQAPSGM